jgi:hypothetical protein
MAGIFQASREAFAMRKLVFLAATAAILLFPARAFCQDQNQQQNQQQNQHGAQPSPPTELEKQKDSAPPSKPPVEAHGQVPAPQQKESLADAARRAREQKKEASKSARTFDNDSLPSQGGISTVGQSAAPAVKAGVSPDAAAATAPAPNDERTWRARFTQLRGKLQRDQQDLDVMQRELGVLDVQQYDDPMKALQEKYTRSDINKKSAAIDAKKKEIEADNQAISDAQDELRKSGGDLSWAQ